MCVSVFLCACVCINTCTYTYIHINASIHTVTQPHTQTYIHKKHILTILLERLQISHDSFVRSFLHDLTIPRACSKLVNDWIWLFLTALVCIILRLWPNKHDLCMYIICACVCELFICACVESVQIAVNELVHLVLICLLSCVWLFGRGP